MTSALFGAHALRLTSVTGPTVTPGAAARGVAEARGVAAARGAAVVATRPVHATPAVDSPSRAAAAKLLNLMATLRHERGRHSRRSHMPRDGCNVRIKHLRFDRYEYRGREPWPGSAVAARPGVPAVLGSVDGIDVRRPGLVGCAPAHGRPGAARGR